MFPLASSQRFIRLLLSLVALVFTPVVLAAQDPPGHVTAWVAGGLSWGGSGTVTTTYEPILKYFTIETGSAGQQVTLDGPRAVAFEAGLDWFFARHIGVEAWIARDGCSFEAPSGTYDTTLRYVSRPPPNYTPIIVDVSSATPWPDVHTSLTHVSVATNLVARWQASPRVGGTFSGGLAFVRTSGDLGELGYTMFALGGHSTLFSNEYRLTTAIVPQTERRANLGGTVDISLGPHAAVIGVVRAVLGGEATPTLRVTAIDRSEAGFDPPTAEDVTEQLSGSSVTVPTRAVHVLGGLKLRF